MHLKSLKLYRHAITFCCSIMAVLLLAPVTAHANAIIPYMVVPWGQLFLLPIIVATEAIVFRHMLKDSYRSALWQSCVANLASTFIGAGIYCATMGSVGEPLFYWWFKGELATEAIRSAVIALVFTLTLWLVSWLVEALVVARLRKAGSWRIVSVTCAIANVLTYSGLLTLALLF